MSAYRYTLAKFFRDWALIFAMLAGVLSYLAYREIPALHPAGPFLDKAVRAVQPALIFLMLFLSFPSQLRPRRLMLYLLQVQCGSYALHAL